MCKGTEAQKASVGSEGRRKFGEAAAAFCGCRQGVRGSRGR